MSLLNTSVMNSKNLSVGEYRPRIRDPRNQGPTHAETVYQLDAPNLHITYSNALNNSLFQFDMLKDYTTGLSMLHF